MARGYVVSIASHMGLFDVYALLRRRVTKSQVAILMYHRVCPKNKPEYLDALSVETFDWQMKYLSENYEIYSLDELADCIVSGKPLPNKAVAITFDDGYKDNYLYAYPTLQKRHIPATIFLATGYIGTDKLFWWDEVGYFIYHSSVKQLDLSELGQFSLGSENARFLAKSVIIERLNNLPSDRKHMAIGKLLASCGVEIPKDLGKKLILSWEEVREMSRAQACKITFGAHSVTHDILVGMPLNQVKDEIVQSKKDIEQEVGKEVSAFCYPNGDFDSRIVSLVRKSGFACAVSILNAQLISQRDDVYKLPRIRAREDYGKFKATLSGVWGDFRAPRLSPSSQKSTLDSARAKITLTSYQRKDAYSRRFQIA